MPFQGRNAQEMMIARLRGKPTPIRQVRPDFPEALAAVIMRSLEADPDDRYDTTLDLGRAAVDALGDAEVRERVEPLLRR